MFPLDLDLKSPDIDRSFLDRPLVSCLDLDLDLDLEEEGDLLFLSFFSLGRLSSSEEDLDFCLSLILVILSCDLDLSRGLSTSLD